MKKLSILIIVAVLLGAFMVPGANKYVYAQSVSASWSSGFQVMNLDTTNPAGIYIYYYNQDGTLTDFSTTTFTNPVQDTVPANSSNTYVTIHAPAGFNGSVMISSDRPVAVISNLIIDVGNSQTRGTDAYTGFSQGGPNLYFPLIMKGNSNIDSTFNIQNTGTAATTVSILFVKQPGSAWTDPTPNPVSDTIQPNAAHTYDLTQMPAFAAVTKWIGSVKVTVSDAVNDSIVGVVSNINKKYSSAYQLSTYNGFLSGSTSVFLPLIMENNNGNRTGVSCQNLDATTTTVTISYTGSGTYTKAQEQQTGIVQNGIATFLADYANTPGIAKFLGSALVTTSPASHIVCIVNEQKPSKAQSASYAGFDPAAATNKIVMPLITSGNGNVANGYHYTSFSIATADGAAHHIQCTFLPSPGYTTPPPLDFGSVAVAVALQNDIFGTGLHTKFVGSAVCTADAGGLIGITNQNREFAPVSIRDVLSTYDDFNQ